MPPPSLAVWYSISHTYFTGRRLVSYQALVSIMQDFIYLGSHEL